MRSALSILLNGPVYKYQTFSAKLNHIQIYRAEKKHRFILKILQMGFVHPGLIGLTSVMDNATS